MTNHGSSDDSLMTAEELESQKQWDEEFRRRREDLERQQLKSRERRRQVSDKMSELKQRWEGVERRRTLRSRQSMNKTPAQSSLSFVRSQHADNTTENTSNNNNNDNR